MGKSIMFSRRSILVMEAWLILRRCMSVPYCEAERITSVERQSSGRGLSTKGTRKCKPAGQRRENWPKRSTIIANPSSTT